MRLRTYGTTEVAELLAVPSYRVQRAAARIGIARHCGQGRRQRWTGTEVVAIAVADHLVKQRDAREDLDLSPAYYVLQFSRPSEMPDHVAWIVGTEVVIHGTTETIMARSKKARRLGYVVRILSLSRLVHLLQDRSAA